MTESEPSPELPGGSLGDEALLDFAGVMRRLRADCEWKRAQTHRSLTRYLLEESFETVEAIEDGSADDLREELGDLLLQVYFHAVIAEDAGDFTLGEVAEGIAAKMRRRNPHVFGPQSGPALAPAEVDAQWQAIKDQEKTREHPMDGVPLTLPALLYADKALERLTRAGQPVPQPVAAARLSSAEIGAGLLALVAQARASEVDPEQALRDAVRALLGA